MDEGLILEDDDGGEPAAGKSAAGSASAAGSSAGATGGGVDGDPAIVEEKKPEAAEAAAAPAAETAAAPEGSFAVSEAEWTALKANLEKRYTEIATLLRYNKTKDESIQRLGAEVQKYRDNFAWSALKPFVNALIALREDCYKTIRDSKQHGITDEKAKKHIDILVSDFEEMLSNIGLERGDGDSITLNGKPLAGAPQPRKVPEEPAAAEQKSDEAAKPLVDVEAITTITELVDYLSKSEEAIRAALADRTVVDKTMQAYMALAARTDAEHYFALIGPVAKKLFVLCDKVSAQSKPATELSGDKLIKFHEAFFDWVAKGLGIVLSVAGVVMERLGEGSLFDTQKHKILKTIPTEDEELDRVIANTYTDCYIYDGKVVYQSKVDVYKFQQGKQGE